MKRISPVLVLLLAAGCANAGISDWLNPFRMFGGKPPAGVATAAASGHGGVQHSPSGPGHRGPRQLYQQHDSPNLGSPAGHLDDGFKPSFPPGFANPPSHSPNLNPFATSTGPGSHGPGKGPLHPSQLTQHHSPSHGGAAPSAASHPPFRPRGRFGFRGRAPPPNAAASSPVGGPPQDSPDGSPIGYGDFSNLGPNGPGGPPNGLDYEESQGPPQLSAAPQRGPRGPPPGYRQRPGGPGGRGPFGRPAGPPPSYNPEGGRPGPGGPGPYGRPLHGGPGGPPSGPPGGPSYLESGPEGGPQGNPFGRPSGPPGPGQLSSNGFGGPPGGGRPDSDAPFFASSPGSNSGPFGGPSDQGRSPFSGSPGQSSSPFGQGPSESLFGEGAPQGPGGPPQGGQGGPPGGGGGPNGPQSFFGANGNDYPEQFEGGSRETREPHPQQLSQADFRPHPNGPPQGLPGLGDLNLNDSPGEQNPGFYGALHNTESGHGQSNGPQNFFGQQQQPGGAPSSLQGGPGGPPQGSPYLSQGHPGQQQQQQLYGGPIQNGPQYAPRPRKPPIRLGLRNPLAGAFQSSASNVPAYSQSHNNHANHGGQPLMMSASGGKPAIMPMPKPGRSLLRPFIRKPGGILPLSSPRDPNYRRMSLSPSNMSPVTASFEPDTAASGGLHGGYGDVGLSHNGDRILYHVSGHHGPHSYRFGFDTGKGHNRIFRFEEKDGKGYVTGKYGFYDKHGKLNLINYQAHPQHGYHAERGHSHGHY